MPFLSRPSSAVQSSSLPAFLYPPGVPPRQNNLTTSRPSPPCWNLADLDGFFRSPQDVRDGSEPKPELEHNKTSLKGVPPDSTPQSADLGQLCDGLDWLIQGRRRQSPQKELENLIPVLTDSLGHTHHIFLMVDPRTGQQQS